MQKGHRFFPISVSLPCLRPSATLSSHRSVLVRIQAYDSVVFVGAKQFLPRHRRFASHHTPSHLTSFPSIQAHYLLRSQWCNRVSLKIGPPACQAPYERCGASSHGPVDPSCRTVHSVLSGLPLALTLSLPRLHYHSFSFLISLSLLIFRSLSFSLSHACCFPPACVLAGIPTCLVLAFLHAFLLACLPACVHPCSGPPALSGFPVVYNVASGVDRLPCMLQNIYHRASRFVGLPLHTL